MQRPRTLSNTSTPLPPPFPPSRKKNIYPKNFLCFEMKPDLTYYHNSSLTLKNFLYFPEKKTLAYFPTPSPKDKTIFPKKSIILRDRCWPSVNFFTLPCTLTLYFKFIIIRDNCWFNQPSEFSKPKRKINKFTLISWKNDFLPKEKNFILGLFSILN